MSRDPRSSAFRNALQKLRSFFRRQPEPPEDPYAMVGAPKKPRPPYRHRAAAESLD